MANPFEQEAQRRARASTNPFESEIQRRQEQATQESVPVEAMATDPVMQRFGTAQQIREPQSRQPGPLGQIAPLPQNMPAKEPDLTEGMDALGVAIYESREEMKEKKASLNQRQNRPSPGLDMAEARKQALDEVASEVGPLDAFLIGAGKGFYDVGRGIGLLDSESESDAQAMEALREKRPYTTGGGEILGQAAPFIPAGLAVGAIPAIGGRILAGAGLGGVEGGVLASGTDNNVLEGAGVGTAIGGTAEALFPVIGRLGRALHRKITGSLPAGAMIDGAGRPMPELQSALNEAGMTFEDLTADAQSLIRNAEPGTNPAQLARAARFTNEGIPISRGELMQEGGFEQRAIENRLLESTNDPQAERFRQFKLKQSESIRTALERSVDTRQLPEDTGNIIKDALAGRKKLLRTQKNELYSEALKAAKESGGIPIFPGSIRDAMPDADTLEDLAITSPAAIDSLTKLGTKYGLIDPTDEMIEAGFEPTTITLENFERLRKTLNAIERGDQTGAASVAIRPMIEALDDEVMNLAETATGMGLSERVVEPLKKARSVVRDMKTEFNPKALAGQLIDVKRNSSEPVIYGSKVYDKLTSKAQPVENVRSVMDSLRRSGDQGVQAIADMQTTTMLDLINSGFSTQSRQVDGVQVFNPIKFKKRLQDIGEGKLKTIFQNNPVGLARLKNIDRIAGDLVSPAGTIPKGSASVILDLMNRVGITAITSKVLGADLFVEQIQRLAEGGANRRAVTDAINASPQTRQVAYRLDREFPGIAAALGISAVSVGSDRSDQNESTPNQ